jgi:hypothetical protein
MSEAEAASLRDGAADARAKAFAWFRRGVKEA